MQNLLFAITLKIILLVGEPSALSARIRADLDASELVYRCTKKCLRYILTDERDPTSSVQCRRGCYYGATSNAQTCRGFCGGSEACALGCQVAHEYWLASLVERTIEDSDESQDSELFVGFGTANNAEPVGRYVANPLGYRIDRTETDRRLAYEPEPSPGFAVMVADIRRKEKAHDDSVKRKRRKVVILSLLCALLGSVLAAAIVITSIYRRRRKEVDNAYSRLEEKMEGTVDGNDYESDGHC